MHSTDPSGRADSTSGRAPSKPHVSAVRLADSVEQDQAPQPWGLADDIASPMRIWGPRREAQRIDRLPVVCRRAARMRLVLCFRGHPPCSRAGTRFCHPRFRYDRDIPDGHSRRHHCRQLRHPRRYRRPDLPRRHRRLDAVYCRDAQRQQLSGFLQLVALWTELRLHGRHSQGRRRLQDWLIVIRPRLPL